MKEINIDEKLAGQKMMRCLERYLSNAPKSFLYKMLRKKNITLNNSKATGDEKLKCGDTIKIFFSDETFENSQLIITEQSMTTTTAEYTGHLI